MSHDAISCSSKVQFEFVSFQWIGFLGLANFSGFSCNKFLGSNWSEPLWIQSCQEMWVESCFKSSSIYIKSLLNQYIPSFYVSPEWLESAAFFSWISTMQIPNRNHKFQALRSLRFLSPHTNRRDDPYGGNAANRRCPEGFLSEQKLSHPRYSHPPNMKHGVNGFPKCVSKSLHWSMVRCLRS